MVLITTMKGLVMYFSFFFFRITQLLKKFRVDAAESVEADGVKDDDDSDIDDDDGGKKKRKKVGFRDRKVSKQQGWWTFISSPYLSPCECSSTTAIYPEGCIYFLLRLKLVKLFFIIS